MFSSRPQAGDVRESPEVRYDPLNAQWMREALENRQLIEELKSHNEKLKHEVYALNSRLALVYECISDLKMMEKLGDLMQKKLRDQQHAQYLKANGHSPTNPNVSPRSRTKQQCNGYYHLDGSNSSNNNNNNRIDSTFICGSSSFQQSAVVQSSYEGQIAREHYHHRNMLDAEESQFRDCDIFGKQRPKSPPKQSAANPNGVPPIEPTSPSRRKQEDHLGGGTGAIVMPTSSTPVPKRSASGFLQPLPSMPYASPVGLSPGGSLAGKANGGDTIDLLLSQQAGSFGGSPTKFCSPNVAAPQGFYTSSSGSNIKPSYPGAFTK